MNIDNRETSKRSVFESFIETFFDRREEVLWNGSTKNLFCPERVFLAWFKSHDNNTIASSTRLFNITTFSFGCRTNGFTINDLLFISRYINLEHVLHLFEKS